MVGTIDGEMSSPKAVEADGLTSVRGVWWRS